MDIDNSRRVLCLAATDPNKDPTWIEFYRVDGVLALQNVTAELGGHPGVDLGHLPPRDGGDGVWCSGHHLPKSSVRKIQGWLERGLFVAVGVGHPGKRKRNRQSLIVSWAKPHDYLTDADMFWLQSYCQSSFIYTDQREVNAAWQRVFTGLAQIATAIEDKPKLKRKAKPSKAKRTRKQQRRQELERRRYGEHV